jgi:hypothetical protein
MVLVKIGFKARYADPCLLNRKGKDGVVHIALYMNDCFCCGNKEEIANVIKDMKNEGFTLKIEREMEEYFSCENAFSKYRNKLWIGQPHLLRKMKESFHKAVAKTPSYKTPGSPHTRLVRASEEDEGMSPEDYTKVRSGTKFRSGIGMLLYLVKHSRPDIVNCTRELSKLMDKPTPAAMKELRRVIKYVLETAGHGLNMHPNKLDKEGNFEVMVYSDSDWAGDKDTRISMTGYCILCKDVL